MSTRFEAVKDQVDWDKVETMSSLITLWPLCILEAFALIIHSEIESRKRRIEISVLEAFKDGPPHLS